MGLQLKLLIMYYIAALACVVLYLYSFFPIATQSVNDVPRPQAISKVPLKYMTENRSLVLILIDSMRLDFVSPDLMPYTYKHMKENGCLNNLKAEFPAFTVPRLKALLMGVITQFVDLVTNVGLSRGATQNSIFHSAKKKGKKMVYYGDHTWLRMFPNVFMRSEELDGGFIWDYTDVDNNVTKHIDAELKKEWDIMVLYYLGVDHLGHIYGPNTEPMNKKLLEMDQVVEKIHKNRDAIILVVGDHGMGDWGGHGGNSKGELETPMAVLGLECDDDSFAQTDFSTNLACLFGLEIPSLSIGRISRKFFKWMPLTEYLSISRYVLVFLMGKLKKCDDFQLATDYHLSYLKEGRESYGKKAEFIYDSCSRAISNELVGKAIKQNLYSLFIAMLAMISLLLSIVFDIHNTIELLSSFSIVIIQLVFALDFLFFYYLFIIPKILFKYLKFRRWPDLKISKFLLLVHVLNPLTYYDQSFVADEQMFWYFFCTSFCLLFFLRKFDYSLLLMALGIRVVRILNFANLGPRLFLLMRNNVHINSNLPDLADWLTSNGVILKIYLSVSLLLVFYCCYKLCTPLLRNVLNFWILNLIFIYKIEPNPDLGKFQFLLIAANFLLTNFISTWLLLSALLLRPENAILIPACWFASQLLQKHLTDNDLILTHLWLGNLLFFAQGFSNGLASIDVTVGFVGLRSYIPAIVIPQVLFHAYIFKIMPFLFIYNQLDFLNLFKVLLIERVYVLSVIFGNSYLKRYHHFIWNVYSPKLLIESLHFLILCLSFFISYFIRKSKNMNNKQLIAYQVLYLNNQIFERSRSLRTTALKLNRTGCFLCCLC